VTLTIRVRASNSRPSPIAFGSRASSSRDRKTSTSSYVERRRDDVLSILKTWQPHELRRIEEAVAAAQKPLVAFLSLDDEDALLAQLRQYGVRELATIHAPGHGKMFPRGTASPCTLTKFSRNFARPKSARRSSSWARGSRGTPFSSISKPRARPCAKVHSHGTAHAGMQGIQGRSKPALGEGLR